MSVDLYMQSSEGSEDGRLILSMSREEWKIAMLHTSLKTGALERFLDEIVGSIEAPEDGSLTPAQIRNFARLFEWEAENMNSYRYNTPENPPIQPNFYLRDVAKVMGISLKKCVDEEREVFMHVSPSMPSPDYDSPGIHNNKEPVLLDFGFGAVRGASITHADEKRRIYCGTIDWSDLMENCNPRDTWVAHPSPTTVRCPSHNGLVIRPSWINTLIGQYEFTLQPDFNRGMEQYISDTIKGFRPGAGYPQ